jgi:hypothetical protein
LKERKSSDGFESSKFAKTYDEIINNTSEFMELPFSEWESSSIPQIKGKSVNYASNNGYYITSVYKQLVILSTRSFRNFIRNIFLFPGHFLFSIFMGLTLGFIFYKLPLDLAGTQDRIGAFFFITVVLSLISMSSLELCKYLYLG